MIFLVSLLVASLVIAAIIYIPVAILYACDVGIWVFFEILLIIIFSPLIIAALILYLIFVVFLGFVGWLGNKFID